MIKKTHYYVSNKGFKPTTVSYYLLGIDQVNHKEPNAAHTSSHPKYQRWMLTLKWVT